MMSPMGRNPVDGSPLQGEYAEYGEEILDAFWQLQASMGEQPVEAERYPEAPR